MAGVDKWKNHKLNLVAKVKTVEDELEGYVEKPSLRRVVLGKGKVYLYVKTDRGYVNTIYERRAYVSNSVELVEIFDRKTKRRMKALDPKNWEATKTS